MIQYALFLNGERLTESRDRRYQAAADAYALRPTWHLEDGYQILEHTPKGESDD